MDFEIVAPYESSGARRELSLRVRAENVTRALSIASAKLEAIRPLLGDATFDAGGPMALLAPAARARAA